MTTMNDAGFQRDTSTGALLVAGYGTELAYAEITSDQTGISTATDVTGLVISFTVGARPVMVEAFFPLIQQVTSTGQAQLTITSGTTGGTALTQATPPSLAANATIGGLVAKYRFAAGTGATAARVRAQTTAGTLTINAISTRKPYIRAYEV